MKRSIFLASILFLNFTSKSITIEPTTKAKIILGISSAVATYGYIERNLAQKELNELEHDKSIASETSKKISDQLGEFLLVQYKKIKSGMGTFYAKQFKTLKLRFDPKAIAQAQAIPNPVLDDARRANDQKKTQIDKSISKFQRDKLVSTLLFGSGAMGTLCSAYYLFRKKYKINFSLSAVN